MARPVCGPRGGCRRVGLPRETAHTSVGCPTPRLHHSRQLPGSTRPPCRPGRSTSARAFHTSGGQEARVWGRRLAGNPDNTGAHEARSHCSNGPRHPRNFSALTTARAGQTRARPPIALSPAAPGAPAPVGSDPARRPAAAGPPRPTRAAPRVGVGRRAAASPERRRRAERSARACRPWSGRARTMFRVTPMHAAKRP